MKRHWSIITFCMCVALLILPLAGCDVAPWDRGMTLVLKVDSPKDGATVSTPAITVSGRVVGTESAGARVKVNDMDAPVKEGKYALEVTLKEGQNQILVNATGGQANLNEKVSVTYAPAK